jgi:hypothetical protein
MQVGTETCRVYQSRQVFFVFLHQALQEFAGCNLPSAIAPRYCAAHPQPSDDAKKVCNPHKHAILGYF